MIFCGPSAKALVSLSPMTAVSGHVRSEWTCEQEVQKKHGRWPLLYHLKSYTRAIPSEELKKAPDHCPSYHLSSEASLIGIPLWHLHLDCTLYLVPQLLLSSAFHICTCTLLLAHSDSLLHTFTCTLLVTVLSSPCFAISSYWHFRWNWHSAWIALL